MSTTTASSMSFPVVARRKRGYDPVQVDAFLERARVVFDGTAQGVSAEDIRRVAFELRPGGYDTAAVDTALERLENVFAERERSAARSKLGDSAYLESARETAQVLVNRLGRPDDHRFDRVTSFTFGYSRREVDRFAHRLIRYFKDGKPVGVEEVRTVTFRSQRGGYVEAQVDLLLDSVVEVMLAVH